MLERRARTLGLVVLATSLVYVAATGRAGGGASLAQRADVDVLGYRIRLELGAQPASLRASTEITVEIMRRNTRRLELDFVGLEVDSLSVDGAPAPFERRDGTLRVELGRRAAERDTVVVRVSYHGAPRDGLIFGTSMYGRPTVFADNWPNRARYWFPAIDHPSDKATVEFDVRAPAAWAVVAVGALREESDLGDGTKRTVWSTDRPIPVYTMVIGAAEMTVREIGRTGCDVESSPCVVITSWTSPEDADVLEQLMRRAPEIVAFFDSLVGPYPYEKLALVQSSTRFGGMENASAIFLTERVGQLSSADGLLAHEIAHQWFGDAVTERQWPHLWLSEGFATYMTTVFFEFSEGDALAAAQRADAEQALYLGRAVNRPIVDREPENPLTLLGPNAFQKGAWVLHMLRLLIGDEAFFAGVRRYYADHRHGTAVSEDLQRIMEEVSGAELDWYFEQWLSQPGIPMLNVEYTWDADDSALRIRVRQVQPSDSFRLPLELVAVGSDYELRQTFWVERPLETLEWTLPSEPVRLVADPDNAIVGSVEVVPGR